MSDDFDRVQRFLVGDLAQEVSDATCARFVGAVRSGRAGPADIAVLVRQVLLWEQARMAELSSEAPPPELRIPKALKAAEEAWKKAGLRVRADGDSVLVKASPWQPQWLEDGELVPPGRALALPEARRMTERAEGDPVLSLIGRTHYLSSGQRGAVHAILTAPSSATLAINLPTGAGKSLCAQLPATLTPDGLSIVVVPTTSLCIDQERAVLEFVKELGSEQTAYYTTRDGARNAGIRERIREGRQRIVFTSPEALTGSLAPSVYASARAGRLRWLVVDEAHIVDQWGDGFRPAFQELAGLRADLLRTDPNTEKFRTLLLSATITPSTLLTLETLFGKPGPFDIASAVQLRPEPSYWRAFCPDGDLAGRETQRLRVIEAVMHLPRPLIVYTTKVAHAEQWFTELQGHGFSRIDLVTGKTSSLDREKVLDRWRARMSDIVVATSAFGLGVDQREVRAVIHACVPENLDRYYQEVGRGGRDGRASISLVIDAADDMKDAAIINDRSIISVEIGLPRWQAMFNEKKPLSNGRWEVSLKSTSRYGMRGDYHEAWNARLLTLMARAGLIELDYAPLLSADAESEEQDTWEAHRSRRVIRIIEDRHDDADVWLHRVEESRERTARQAREGLSRLKAALLGSDRCIAETLAEMYSIEGRAHVALACGGCRYCRKHRIGPRCDPMPPVKPVWSQNVPTGPMLGSKLEHNALAVFCDPEQQRNWKRHILPIVEWLVKQGVLNLVVPKESRAMWSASLRDLRPPIMLHDVQSFEPMWMARAASAIVHPGGLEIPAGNYLPDAGDARVVFLPVDARDSSAPHRFLRSTIRCRAVSLPQLTMELGL